MAALARTELLERKIDKHMRAYVDEMKHFRNELQILRAMPKLKRPPTTTKDQRPLNDANKKLAHNSKSANMSSAKPLKKVHADGRSLNTNNYYSGDKMTNNKTNLQHHPCDDEHMMKNGISRTTSFHTLNSRSTRISTPETAMTKINYQGSIVAMPVSPLKLLQFHIMELETKLKDYVPEDETCVAKLLKEINYAINQAAFERKVNGSSSTSQAMKNQTTDVEGNRMANDKNYTSKDTQTDLYGDGVEKLFDFQGKYLEKQLEMDTNLRKLEEIFTIELRRSDEKVSKFSREINSLQSKLHAGIDESATTMSHHIDLKIEEVKGEMKFLMGMIEGTKNHNLIDNMNKKLEQTHKKISDVKRKCTETAKTCLKMHQNTHASESKQIGCELGQIKCQVWNEIEALKNVMSVHEQHHAITPREQLIKLKSTASSSFRSDFLDTNKIFITANAPIRRASAESIKSMTTAKLNEKCSIKKKKRNISSLHTDDDDDGKFSIKIDDERDNEYLSTSPLMSEGI